MCNDFENCSLMNLNIFFEKIDNMIKEMGIFVKEGNTNNGRNLCAKDILRLEDAVGLGYARTTDEELSKIGNIAQKCGIVLDPVYSGKAALRMIKDLSEGGKKMMGGKRKKVLFIHTGGLLGLYDKDNQMQSILNSLPSSNLPKPF